MLRRSSFDAVARRIEHLRPFDIREKYPPSAALEPQLVQGDHAVIVKSLRPAPIGRRNDGANLRDVAHLADQFDRIDGMSKKTREERLVPFGPFLMAAGLITFYFGEALIAWYVTTFLA